MKTTPPGPEPVSRRKAVRLARDVSSTQADERRKDAEEEKTARRSQYSRSSRFAHGGTIHAPQPNRAGGLLPSHRAPQKRGRSGIRDSEEIGHADLPPATGGASLTWTRAQRPTKSATRKSVSK